MSREKEFKDIKFREGFYWPEKDIKCWPWLQEEKDLPNLISNFCKNKRTVIEAGGNGGFYIKKYSDLFNKVITFEPDDMNFKCLTLNMLNLGVNNVVKIQACLGNEHKNVSITTSIKNTGAYRIEQGVDGNIPTFLIDDLNSTDCDLIHLDIEGFEYFALKGAEETIKKNKPVIAVEWMNHGEKYGCSDLMIEDYLKSLNYELKQKIYHEAIFVYKT